MSTYKKYHPYGTTAFQAMNGEVNATAKRYRFAGKERDEESGLYYHGARYYAPWLGRWTATDPLEAEYAGWSSYNYCFDNPVNHTDSTGMGPDEPQKMPEVTLDEVEVKASRYTVPTVDNATLWRMDPAKIEGAKERMAQQRRYDEQEVLMADSYGKGYAGSRKDVTARVGAVNQERQNQVADNIRGGLGGAVGYTFWGEWGSFAGAIFDGVLMSLSGVGTPYGKTETKEPTKLPETFRKEQVKYGGIDIINTIPKMIKQSPRTNFEVIQEKGTYNELDRYSASHRFIAEEKSAEGMYKLNPKTGQPAKTPDEWAGWHIYSKTVGKIVAIQVGIGTQTTKHTKGSLPTIDMLRQVKDYRFIIATTDPRVINAVNIQLKNLSQKFPNWTFRAFFGK